MTTIENNKVTVHMMCPECFEIRKFEVGRYTWDITRMGMNLVEGLGARYTCRELYSECDHCGNENMFHVDSGMAHIIQVLNRKGYLTDFCCEGHVEEEDSYPYILFKYGVVTKEELAPYMCFGWKIDEEFNDIELNPPQDELTGRVRIHLDESMYETYKDMPLFKDDYLRGLELIVNGLPLKSRTDLPKRKVKMASLYGEWGNPGDEKTGNCDDTTPTDMSNMFSNIKLTIDNPRSTKTDDSKESLEEELGFIPLRKTGKFKENLFPPATSIKPEKKGKRIYGLLKSDIKSITTTAEMDDDTGEVKFSTKVFVWNGSEWEGLGSNIDLDAYANKATKKEVSDVLATIAEAERTRESSEITDFAESSDSPKCTECKCNLCVHKYGDDECPGCDSCLYKDEFLGENERCDNYKTIFSSGVSDRAIHQMIENVYKPVIELVGVLVSIKDKENRCMCSKCICSTCVHRNGDSVCEGCVDESHECDDILLSTEKCKFYVEDKFCEGCLCKTCKRNMPVSVAIRNKLATTCVSCSHCKDGSLIKRSKSDCYYYARYVEECE